MTHPLRWEIEATISNSSILQLTSNWFGSFLKTMALLNWIQPLTNSLARYFRQVTKAGGLCQDSRCTGSRMAGWLCGHALSWSQMCSSQWTSIRRSTISRRALSWQGKTSWMKELQGWWLYMERGISTSLHWRWYYLRKLTNSMLKWKRIEISGGS